MAQIDTNDNHIIYKELSYKIIGLAIEVHKILGYGFLEKVYENSLMKLFDRERITAFQQVAVPVYFEGEIVGDFYADILVENQIILELKAVNTINDAHRAQVINYLKATKLKLGILINFGKCRLEQERFVL
ncbi:MAG: GxxExxY protein [Spirochaetota bacterium]|nr:GxxExxY protein [Spirochaetota bacterium]